VVVLVSIPVLPISWTKGDWTVIKWL